MEKKDYNDNYSRVRHSNAKNRTMIFWVSTHGRELSVGERKQRDRKDITCKQSVWKQETVSKTDRGPAVKRERIRPDRESEDRTEWSVQTGNKKW